MLSVKRPSAAASQAEAQAFPPRPVTSPLSAQVPVTPTLFPPPDGRSATGELVNTQNRIPVVIKGDLKRPDPLPPRSREAHRKHSKRLWILGTAMLLMTIAATLFAATPQGRDLTLKLSGNPAATVGNAASQQNSGGTGISAQATATWMYQNDGYDPYSHGQVLVSAGKISLPWPYGQCTYWANYEYHKETGFWVQWTGNADQWFLGAQRAGWDYAQKPPIGIPSIIVLMPFVQGAGWLGHVAVVESQTGNVVHTSNMNWGFGGSTHVEYVDFTLGAGVYFVWHPPVG